MEQCSQGFVSYIRNNSALRRSIESLAVGGGPGQSEWCLCVLGMGVSCMRIGVLRFEGIGGICPI